MLFLLVFYILTFAQANMYVGFTFSQQLPNVARVDEAYSFTLANTTYKSDSGDVTYWASNLPSWLSFDSSSRTFTGTPSSSDVTEFEITLGGYDNEDSISQNYSMIVSNSTGIHLSSADVMFTEIAKYGYTNGVDGLVVKPGEEFDITFDTSVFSLDEDATMPIIAYYGRSEDRTSLPNWISFDASSLTFSGTAPYVTSEIAPSVEYGFSFIASDYYNFAGAVGVFKIVIGAHELSTSLNETIKVNGTLGEEFDISVPVFSDVLLDGYAISQDNISSCYADNLPSYITLDTSNYTLSGQFPNSSTFDNFSIIIDDVYGNSVELPYSFDAIDSIFTVDHLKNVNATRGEYFQYQLMESYFTDYDETTINALFNSSWLTYNSSNRTFNGNAPKSLDTLVIEISASSYFDSESKDFDIIGIDAVVKASSSSSSSATATSSSTSSSSSNTSDAPIGAVVSKSSSGVDHKALAIGLGVGIPVFILSVAAIFLFCCFKRRKSNSKEKQDEELGNRSPELNGPGFGTTIDNDDSNEDAKRMATLNVLKLEGKDKILSDDHSTSSSITHVESEYSDDSRYFDAADKPTKSWRANDVSDVADAAIAAELAKKKLRISDASMSTVNTEQLFSVRLVEDQSYRNSNISSFGSQQFFSNGSLNGLLRDSSGNIQRLDSFGNVVDGANTPIERKRLSRSPSANLNMVVEENTSSNTNKDSTIYHSSNADQHDNESSSINLLSKFDQSGNIIHENSAGDLLDIDHASNDSITYEFKASSQDGEYKWLEADNKGNDPMLNPNSSELSIVSASSDTNLTSAKIRGANIASNNNNSKAKLVEFTRKGSLRESSYDPDYVYRAETARIHNDDSD